MRRILALDIATRTGWHTSDHIGGSVDFSRYKADRGELQEMFDRWLSDLLARHRPTLLVIERPAYSSASNSQAFLAGLAQAAHATAWRHGIVRTEADSHAVRKLILGDAAYAAIRKKRPDDKSGAVRNRLKHAVMDWCQQYGVMPQDDNHADAVAMVAWALRTCGRKAA